jgi:UDP-sugar diphosphatase
LCNSSFTCAPPSKSHSERYLKACPLTHTAQIPRTGLLMPNCGRAVLLAFHAKSSGFNPESKRNLSLLIRPTCRLLHPIMSNASGKANAQRSVMTRIERMDTKDARFIRPVMIHYEQDGRPMQWEAVLAHDSVSVILFNRTSRKLVFVKQFRPAVMMSSEYAYDMQPRPVPLKTDAYTIELCSGIVDKPDKSLIQIVQEEIQEEVGFDVPLHQIEPVTSYRAHVGINGAVQNLYFAQVDESQRSGVGGGVCGESIEVIEMTIDECCKGLLYTDDSKAVSPRTSGLLYAITWFMYEKWPKLSAQ